MQGQVKTNSMSWPLPSFLLNSDGNSWLEDYIGPPSKIPDIGGNVRMNSQVIICDGKAYLSFGPLSSSGAGGPASNDFHGPHS